MLLTAAVLAVPIIPFLILGSAFEADVEEWFRREWSLKLRFALVVVLLSADLLLPVPSSMVSTYAGGVMGLWPAAAASWLGMTLGAVIGFALARLLGRPFAARRTSSADAAALASLASRFGPLALVLTRALPILAEACVLLLGAAGLSWRRFLIPVAIANLAIAVTYSACGVYFQGRDSLPAAVIAAGVLPLLAALATRRWLSRDEASPAISNEDAAPRGEDDRP